MKLIEVNEFNFIETNVQETIDKATTANLIITDIPTNINDYKSDDSDRPEVITEKAILEAQTLAQAEADIENKKIVIDEILKLEKNTKSKTTLEAMLYSEISELFSELLIPDKPVIEEEL